jgi:hypothetical protein
MAVPILGQPEPSTLEDVIAELFNRTERLALGLVAITQVLVDNGLITDEETAEEEPSDDASPAAA